MAELLCHTFDVFGKFFSSLFQQMFVFCGSIILFVQKVTLRVDVEVYFVEIIFAPYVNPTFGAVLASLDPLQYAIFMKNMTAKRRVHRIAPVS